MTHFSLLKNRKLMFGEKHIRTNITIFNFLLTKLKLTCLNDSPVLIDKFTSKLILKFFYSQMIARTIKTIDTLVDSLPSEESSTQLQTETLKTVHSGEIYNLS